MKELPTVSIVVACHSKSEELEVLLGSLVHQKRYSSAPHSREPNKMVPFAKCSDWPVKDRPGLQVILSWDGPNSYWLPHNLNPGLNPVFIVNPGQGPPGHGTRDPGIKAATGDWVVLTNCDNYFVAGWLHTIMRSLIDTKCGMITWNWVSNLSGWNCQASDPKTRGRIDLQCAVVRTEVAQKVGFLPPFLYDSDFDYLNKCYKLVNRRSLRVVHYPHALCVHN